MGNSDEHQDISLDELVSRKVTIRKRLPIPLLPSEGEGNRFLHNVGNHPPDTQFHKPENCNLDFSNGIKI